MGGGSGGGGTTVVQPSTSTTVQDIPEWEQGYVTDLLGKAQTISNQPYQQFPGQEIAGFTPDQLSAFSGIENLNGTFQPTTQSGINSAQAGANTASGIYNAGAGNINAATGYNPLAAVAPYLGAAAGYNSAAASQPWLNQAAGYQNAAANTATPQGIQSYMSPYTNSVVQGLQNEANLNWNQNIMPGVNDKFVGSGQYGSGRNAQVLGQAAGNFQTGLSSNIANALESGYNTAGQQANQQAQLLSGLGSQSLTGAGVAGNAQTSQVNNLLSQAGAAGTATQQQAGNLQNAGINLGNLQATQGQQQVAAGTALGNLGNTQLQQGTNYNTALQAAGQQQQQLNQSNLNQAQTDWQNQVNWPAQQTQYLNQIIRGLPTPTASTQAAQTPAYSVSPLAGIGGALTAGLGSVLGQKEGGLVEGYAKGGMVDDSDEDDNPLLNPLDMQSDADADDVADAASANDNVGTNISPLDTASDTEDQSDETAAPASPLSDEQSAAPSQESQENEDKQTSGAAPTNPLDTTPAGGITPQMLQSQNLLAIARGMLTPTLGGHGGFTALGNAVGDYADSQMKGMSLMAQQNALNYQREQEAKKLGIEQQNADTLKAYRENGGGSMNKIVSVIDPVTNKPVLMPAKDAIAKGLTPTAGYNATTVTLSPAEIDKAADALAAGATPSSIGLGYGNNANKTAVLNRVAEKHPDVQLTDAQTELLSNRAGARKVGNIMGGVEYASESLGGMIPLAKEAYTKIDRTQYPSINAIENAVAKGTGDTNIIALNNYINAIKSDQAILFKRGGDSTDAAAAKADAAVNSAFTSGQFNAYADSLQNEIKVQKASGKGALGNFKSNGATLPASQGNTGSTSAPTKTINGVTYTKVNGQWQVQ